MPTRSCRSSSSRSASRYRLTFLRRHRDARRRAGDRGAVIRRNLGLILVGFVRLSPRRQSTRTWDDLRRWAGRASSPSLPAELFQTLVHIALTSLWVLPVIAAGRSPARRVPGRRPPALHLGLSSLVLVRLCLDAKPVIDGGPLGFLSWAIPILVGSLAYDLVREQGPAGAIRPLLKWGAILAVFGYALSCLNAIFNPVQGTGLARFLVEPPFWPPSRPVDLWTMSQRAGSNSYLWFAAGFSLLVYALFVWASDMKGWRLGVFHVFGVNPLAGYIIHDMVGEAVRPFGPRDAPLVWVLFVFAVVLRHRVAAAPRPRPAENLSPDVRADASL